MTPECTIKHIIFQNFLGGHAQTPLRDGQPLRDWEDTAKFEPPSKKSWLRPWVALIFCKKNTSRWATYSMYSARTTLESIKTHQMLLCDVVFLLCCNIVYDTIPYIQSTLGKFSPLGYELVFLPLYKVENTPFFIQGDDVSFFILGSSNRICYQV